MQNVWSITGRSIAVSALALSLAACQSMRGHITQRMYWQVGV